MTITLKLSSELKTSAPEPKAKIFSTLLDGIATELREAPALTDEAVSRAGIYIDHL